MGYRTRKTLGLRQYVGLAGLMFSCSIACSADAGPRLFTYTYDYTPQAISLAADRTSGQGLQIVSEGRADHRDLASRPSPYSKDGNHQPLDLRQLAQMPNRQTRVKQEQALKLASSELVSAVWMSQAAVTQMAQIASSEAATIQIARNDSARLGQLMPAAGSNSVISAPAPTPTLELPPPPADDPALTPEAKVVKDLTNAPSKVTVTVQRPAAVVTPSANLKDLPPPADVTVKLQPPSPVAPQAVLPQAMPAQSTVVEVKTMPAIPGGDAPAVTLHDLPAKSKVTVEVPSKPASGSMPSSPAKVTVEIEPKTKTKVVPLPSDTPLLPDAPLSDESKKIVDRLPPQKSKRNNKKTPVVIEHQQKSRLDAPDVRKHEGVGISISVHQPRANISHMLEQAYDALINGQQEDAITLYKQVLDEQPENRLALFGLATTYHRAGQIELARPLYGRLLAIDPNNQEGLNNFLVLLGDESPGEAIYEMKKLERTHPDFSPLPAQMAVIYIKMGKYDLAVQKMKQAIELSPENIKYRYDMAVMLDKQGDWEAAAAYYQQLLTASDRGEKLPTNPEEIQERLTFIRSNTPKF